MLFGGNITKQPCFSDSYQENIDYKISGELLKTDIIMKDSFWIGVYPGMTEEMIDYMTEIIKKSVHNS